MRIVIIMAILANFIFAKDAFVSDIKTDLFDTTNNQVVGEIYEGSKVKVLEKKGDLSLVEVSGEVAANNPKVLAYKKEPLLTLLSLKDDTAKPNMKFWVKTSELSDNKAEAWDEVDLFYYDTCSSCHAAHKPKEHSMHEWEAYLSAMQSFAKINDEEKARILRYLQAFAKDGPASKK